MIHEIQEGYVETIAQSSGIVVIAFFHPRGNSLPLAMLNELALEIHSAGLNEEVKVVILKSDGDGAFCGGASFSELSMIDNLEAGKKFFNGFAQVINAMRKCPKLIIARVHGKCVGGGVGLVAAADYAIATEGADIKLSELSIGLGPFVVGAVIQRKIGLSAFSQLAIDATMWRPADWARRKGLFAELHPNTAHMDESVQRLANELSHSHPEAMAQLKKMLWEGTESWDELLSKKATVSGKLVLSPYTKNALERFNSKKKQS